ncbi:MAG: hypothetical protein JKX70_04990 [Phycisphaerales bacterium]|nr:hypothetical protein [Phycisphaerales bacterium]
MFLRKIGLSRVWISGASVAVVGLFSGVVDAQDLLYSQLPTTGGGVTWNSSFWVDPNDQDDSDNDSMAWEDFTQDHRISVTRVRWWGEAMPALGFSVSFFNQDPNTIAVQPDIFGANPSGAIFEETFPFPTFQGSGGLTMFTVDLSTPMIFEANTRYFVSVVGLTPTPFPNWGWGASDTNNNGTFYWIRGQHTYSNLPDDRAVELYGDCLDCASPCQADLTGDGVLNFFDVSAFLIAFSAGDPGADFTGDGAFNFFDVSALLTAFAAGCP